MTVTDQPAVCQLETAPRGLQADSPAARSTLFDGPVCYEAVDQRGQRIADRQARPENENCNDLASIGPRFPRQHRTPRLYLNGAQGPAFERSRV